MSNSIEFVAGNGIEITADNTNKTLTLNNTSALTPEQLEKIRNGLSGSNKFVTLEEVKELIKNNEGGNSNTPPEGFPKLITISQEIVVPLDGRYKVSLVGGGAAGIIYYGGHLSYYNTGNRTSIRLNNLEILYADGGMWNTTDPPYNPNITPYIRGQNKGGADGKNGESNGAGRAGKGFSEHHVGGGGGSPLNYDVSSIYSEVWTKDGIPPISKMDQASGYGAGGSGFNGLGYNSPPGALDVIVGGSSGILVVRTFDFIKNDILKIQIGAGGNSLAGYINQNMIHIKTGAGVQGAALIEWLG